MITKSMTTMGGIRVGLVAVVLCLLVACAYGQAIPPTRALGAPETPLNITGWERVMFISAHPDDIEGCAGGLVSILTSQPNPPEIWYVILTNGDKGCANTFCANWSSEQIAYVRSQEAVAAAAVLNVPAQNVILLDYEDGMLTSYPEQDPRQLLVQQIRTHQPNVVFTWYPYPNFNLQSHLGWDDLGYHPDHQQAGKLALDASFDAGVPLLWPTAGPAWSPSEFYMFAFTNGVNYVELSQTALNAKIDAYLAHKTQVPDNQQLVIDGFTWIVEATANATGVPGVTYAESFIPFY